MCHASINNAFRHFGVGDAGRTVNDQGADALFEEVGRFLSKPGAGEHLKRNFDNISSDIRSLATDSHFAPQITERLLGLINEVDATTAEFIKEQIASLKKLKKKGK